MAVFDVETALENVRLGSFPQETFSDILQKPKCHLWPSPVKYP